MNLETTLTDNPMKDLPLVLLTVGDSADEFETLYDHLESVDNDPEPRFQSLIVALPSIPGMLLKVLRSRTEKMPHVHLRKLNEDPNNCSELPHQTGTFLVTKPKES